ncbi:hypothetical protein M3J09_006091 [Ascochyta lentis]
MRRATLYCVPSRRGLVERPAMLALPISERSMKEKTLDDQRDQMTQVCEM